MYCAVDIMPNQRIISRHRTIKEAFAACGRHNRMIGRHSPGSYVEMHVYPEKNKAYAGKYDGCVRIGNNEIIGIREWTDEEQNDLDEALMETDGSEL